jgi:hypothetical protein
MTPFLAVYFLLLGSIIPEADHLAVNLRQGELETAVLSNSPALVAQAIEDGASPNRAFVLSPARLNALRSWSPQAGRYFSEETKATPLMVAASLGRAEVCHCLLTRGARRFNSSGWGWVAAQYAAKCGYPKLAQSLFEADPLAAHYRIEIGLNLQKIVLYRDGHPCVTGNISTGRQGYDTPPGEYLVTDKERTRRSSLYKVPMPYFLRLSFGEYGIHQGYDPGRPASHGCIRVGRESVAKAIFEQTPIGTLVTID